ncbi:spermidine/putrescine ABC transporter ATPase subunit [Cellulomonas flavigena DSM 20109]|uniref:Spermidine/putrescine import ATP-binding protein PotA n=1 Tax=Cellulomonas flavigena (strain ATCC 482 / DSM 20109 / BCRC 11376 / JCM 18109 / NBRC 3775 / NCIMB 8073 / NRS 134) TaxID=446466 RepID=D5UD58_CELFN|nr:ABC transporter ATP-binding protein [Cellulomonas flavigena]ADG74395.1 spermidine/putrescine ABC transporter ATPase subunit [Cellulomonas flavigena DSM 20109]
MTAVRDERGAALELASVTKRFGDFVAVDDLTLTVPSGSFFALLGPSGCGKTTTLRMVAGLEQPSAGTIGLAGRDVTGVPAHRRPVNTVFQSYALFPHLSVLENVAFGLRRRRARQVRERALEALDLVELAHLAQRRPAQLSGGQQQRVALARAVVNRPALLLLDEPLGALDLKLRRHMQLELKAIQAEVGLTFVHVTHDQEEAMTMADTVAVMNHGRIEQLGPPADLYEHPRTAFVANFLGQSNLVPGRAAGSSADGTTLGVDVGGAWVRVPAVRSVASSQRVLVGVRPEKIRLLGEGHQPRGDENVLGPGTVVDTSFAGVSTQYQVEVAGLGRFGVFAQNVGGSTVHAPGDRVLLAWDVPYTFALDGHEESDAGTLGPDDEP